jgi:phosphoribosyl-AMP cyclohydrolase
MQPDQLNFGDNGLVAAVAQHHQSGQILMLGYANREAIDRTLASGSAWFYSRSRQALWQKGETSGNVLRVHGIRVDCDGDALIYLSEPTGPTCHTVSPMGSSSKA